MSKRERNSRKDRSVKSQPQRFQVVTRNIRVPVVSPQARRIYETIRAVWTDAVVSRVRLLEIAARLECVDSYLQLGSGEGDFSADLHEEILNQARRTLEGLLEDSRERSLKLIAEELGTTKAQVVKYGQSAGILGL